MSVFWRFRVSSSVKSSVYFYGKPCPRPFEGTIRLSVARIVPYFCVHVARFFIEKLKKMASRLPAAAIAIGPCEARKPFPGTKHLPGALQVVSQVPVMRIGFVPFQPPPCAFMLPSDKGRGIAAAPLVRANGHSALGYALQPAVTSSPSPSGTSRWRRSP